MAKKQTQIRVKPALVKKLEKLNHETIGRIADHLRTEPQTIWRHIRKQTPTLTRYDWLKEIQRELSLDTIDEITEQI